MKKQSWMTGIILLLAGLFAYLLYVRWQVSALRFFDVDEFSYMHWTAQIARGQHMYTDFFSYFTPGFMWVFAPIFRVVGKSAQVFTAARMVEFCIFLGILGSVGYLFGITRGWKWALLPMVILAFLPMPYDKFLEIRPDNLATLLAILGVIGEIRAIGSKNKLWWFISGLAYSASLFALVKTVPIVAVGVGIAVLDAWAARHIKTLWTFFAGFLGPWILFFAGAAISGQFHAVWYSLTKLAFEVYASTKNYPMEANLFFYPNASFYGGSGHGITGGLLANHALWLLAIVVGTYRLVTPFGRGREAFVQLLIAGAFFVSIFGYVKFFPLKHSQYLIPIAVYVAFFAADGLSVFFDWLSRVGGYESLVVILIGCTYLLVTISRDVNGPKLNVTNTVQLSELSALIRLVPREARVVDLEGRMVFWPEGYPICCLPFDTFLPLLSEQILPFLLYNDAYPAQYIWDGDSGRLAAMTAQNQAYIRAQYEPVAGWGGRLWQKK